MPGLLTLHTDLKSLKYGHDTPGGGDSGQPYITTDINTVDTNFNKLRLTKFDDGLVRGGIIGAANASVVDTLRIGKFLTSFPKGPLFITKQIGLQLSNPRLEVPKNPINIAAGGVNNILSVSTGGLLQPTRLYNLGINTIAQIPVNAFGLHFNRHGILPVQGKDSKYEAIVTANNKSNNRLETLTNNFNLGPWGANKYGVTKKEQSFLNKLAGQALLAGPLGSVIFAGATAILNTNTETQIDNYTGGPGSVYGIGKTIIHRALGGNTEDKDKIEFAKVQSKIFAGKTKDEKGNAAEVEFKLDRLLGASNHTPSTLQNQTSPTDGPLSNNDKYIPINLNTNISKEEDKHGVNTDHVKNSLTNGNANLVAGKLFGLSNASSSSLSSFKYGPNTTIANTPGKTPTTLDDKIALVNDPNTPHIRDQNLPPVSNEHDLTKSGPSSYPTVPSGSFSNALGLPNIQFNQYSSVQTAVNNLTAPNNVGIYATLINKQLNKERLPKSTNKPTYTNSFGEKVIVGIPWNKATREIRVGSGRKDSINLTPIFSAGVGSIGDTAPIHIPNTTAQTINDLVKFRIQAIDTDNPSNSKWMIFRAYLTDLNDTVNATWNEIKYAGRGDKFWIYDSFTRKISISFKAAALSAEEMEPMYQKLNFLMSNLMPDYKNNLMRGPLVRMTVGNWIDGQLGILDSLTYKVAQDSPWEIGLADAELILPHIVEVTLGFTPIGSQTRDSNELARKAECVSNIAQNWNGATEREYIKPCNKPTAPTPPPPPVPPPPIPPPPPPPFKLDPPKIEILRDNTNIAGPGGRYKGGGF